jgi:outer membrane protein OmpA-like peptidoglycan-associated protein
MPRLVGWTPLIALMLLGGVAWAQKYGPDDPLPPDVKVVILPLKGQAFDLKATVLELRGIASGMQARVDPVKAALKDLGARVTEREIKIDLSADVLFDFDKADLRPEAGPSLTKVAAIMNTYPKASALIEGHTDGKGSDQYNQRLSDRRADSVRRWLAAAGVKTAMSARGWGTTKPVAPNAKPDGSDDPVGRQKNRRVEITVRTQ